MALGLFNNNTSTKHQAKGVIKPETSLGVTGGRETSARFVGFSGVPKPSLATASPRLTEIINSGKLDGVADEQLTLLMTSNSKDCKPDKTTSQASLKASQEAIKLFFLCGRQYVTTAKQNYDYPFILIILLLLFGRK